MAQKKHKAAPAKARSFGSVTKWHIDCDVAVVGFGSAGACAAIEAQRAGAHVALFDVASASGGTTALSSGEIYMGGNGGTPPQQAAGFNDDTEDMFRYLMMASGANADEAKVRMYCEGSRAHFDWLKEQGVPFKNTFHNEKVIIHMSDDCLLYSGNEEAWPFCEKAKACPRGHKPQIEGDFGGRLLMEKLSAVVEGSQGLQVHYNARTLNTIMDYGSGKVHGIVVRIDGEQRNVRARRGVILCAGGFAMNREMLRRYAPALLRPTDPIGNPGDDGSGIRIGMGAGGAAINMGEGFVTVPFYPPASLVKGIFVNEQGQRFINEDCYHGRVGAFALRQPGNGRCFLILDNEIFARPDEAMNIKLAGAGESIAELEKELQLPEKSLQSTVELFNHHAAQGADPMFHKQPKFLKALDQGPYAALDCSLGHSYYPFFTLGGLDTKPTGEVRNCDGEVIPGLYAAGRNACGLPRSGAGYSSGMSVGDATFSGRQAGRTAGLAAPLLD